MSQRCPTFSSVWQNKFVHYFSISYFRVFNLFVIIKHLKKLMNAKHTVMFCSRSWWRCANYWMLWVSFPGDNWFHLECLGLDQDDVLDDDFYCSEDCKKRRAYKYCCNVDLKEPIVACYNDCCKTEWFHMKCVGLKKAPGKLFTFFFVVNVNVSDST